MTAEVRTNNVPRDVLDSCELTAAERAEFDYLDWNALDAGDDSASFFRFKGQVYDLGEFMASTNPELTGWDGYLSETFFSSIVVRFVDDGERIIVGHAFA